MKYFLPEKEVFMGSCPYGLEVVMCFGLLAIWMNSVLPNLWFLVTSTLIQCTDQPQMQWHMIA